jgi:outer membrane lipoprotein-sorting protein
MNRSRKASAKQQAAAFEEASMRRCVSRAALVLLMLVSAGAAHAQTVDEIIAKNIEAKGGAAKWKSVNTVKMTGKISMQGMDLPLTVYAKRPNYNRQEIVLQDKQLVQAFDGTTAWLINPMMGSDVAQELPGPAAEMMRNTADFDGALIDYKAKGHTVEFVGKEKLDATEVYHLKVTMKGGSHVQHYYLDAKSGIELKTSADIDMGTGTKQALETEMSNFQQVNGIMIPHTVKQTVNGKPVVQMTIDKVEFNSAIDDTLFRMPKK